MRTSVCHCYIGNLKYRLRNLAFSWIILTDVIGYTWFFPPIKNSWISYLSLNKAGESVTRMETFISCKRRQDVRRYIRTSIRNHAFRGCFHSYPRDSWSVRPCIIEDFWLLGCQCCVVWYYEDGGSLFLRHARQISAKLHGTLKL
jgi:hypothetical protein